MPKPGERCAYTGLSRTELYKLTSGKNPPVYSKTLLASGAKRGTRLISYESLIGYIVRFGRSSGKLPESLKAFASLAPEIIAVRSGEPLTAKHEQFMLPFDDPASSHSAVASASSRAEFSIIDFRDEVRSLEEAGYPDFVAHSMVLSGWCHDLSRNLSQDQVEELLAAG